MRLLSFVLLLLRTTRTSSPLLPKIQMLFASSTCDNQGKRFSSFVDTLQHSTALSGIHRGEVCLPPVVMTRWCWSGTCYMRTRALRLAMNTLLQHLLLQQLRNRPIMVQEPRMFR